MPEATSHPASAPVSSDRPVCRDTAGRDRQLKLSRRIDWRFLLPDPNLGRVVLLGDADPTLVAALREFSGSFDRIGIDQSVERNGEDGCDVVVVQSRRRDALVAASRLLRDGGCLYWEFGPDRPGRFPASAEFRERLEDLGFQDVRCHAHRPTFQSCVEIVPLHDEDIISYVLGRRAGSWRGAARLVAARALRRFGLLGLLMPCWSVLARRGFNGGTTDE